MFFSPDTPPERRSWPRRLINRLEINRAVFYALALRGWQLVGGAVSALLISRFFSPDVQGFYYTFGSLVALQTFFELGLARVVVVMASHEWARLGLNQAGEIVGDAIARARLGSLLRLAVAWFAVVCFLFVGVVGSIGVYFFLQSPSQNVQWMSPWLALALLSGLLLWMLPLVSLLEGCDQVAVVNRFRLMQAISANLVVWICIVSGANLWTAVAAAAARFSYDAYLVLVRYGRFLRPLWLLSPEPRLDWSREVWPMQWRLGLSGVFGYFAFAFFIPVIFHYHGAKVAGQTGMTWTLVTVLQQGALSWVQARTPLFGMLISKQDFPELDRVFFRLAGMSFALLAAGCIAFEGFVLALDAADVWLSDRILPPLPTALFLLVTLVNHFPRCQDFYLRAFRREPLLALNIISSTSIGILVWLLGRTYGPTGAGAAYLAISALCAAPYQTYLFFRYRAEWTTPTT